MYDSWTDLAIAKPNGGSGGITCTFTPILSPSTTPNTSPWHPLCFPFVSSTLHPDGNLSVSVIGPLSINRGSGAGAFQRPICNGTSASSLPKTFFVDPFTGDVFMPCRGTSLSLIWILPISTPPEPGTPAPFKYCCPIVVVSDSQRSASAFVNFFTFFFFFTVRTSQVASDTATTLPSCIIGQFTKRDFPSTLSASSVASGSCGILCRVRNVLGYFEGIPKQFSPIGRSSEDAMGNTFRDGKPGYGICVPGTSSGLNDTSSWSGSSRMSTRELHLVMSGSPISLLQDGTVSFTAPS
mmetsp:Transcript_26308/g.77784  ORF Transcript_26308/g.77784 Transcript_26308/m.77784 type:complete len:296 (+) Transcript_26308:2024-2911(+)